VPAYVIANVDVRDPEAYEEYRALVPATIAEHGGHYLARGGATEVSEGDWEPKRLVIVEFPSVEEARAWVRSESYEPVKAIRHRTADTQLVIVDGVAGL
jgi:uncharacterized protein (DUF1330 family)